MNPQPKSLQLADELETNFLILGLPQLKEAADELRRLYAQREWQRLTDDEMSKAWCQSKGDLWFRLKPFAHAIEAKLKEKNT
jgi:hypothetical protein